MHRQVTDWCPAVPGELRTSMEFKLCLALPPSRHVWALRNLMLVPSTA